MAFHSEHFHEAGAPTVIVPDRVIKTAGEPSINFDGLGKLFEEDLSLPAEDMTIKFHGGTALGIAPPPLDFWRNGWRTPFSNTLHVPAANAAGNTPMHRVIALGVQTKEVRERSMPVRFLGSELTVGGAGILTLGLEVNSPLVAMVGTGSVCIAGIAKAHASNPAEGRQLDIRELRKAHDSDITFNNQLNRATYLDREVSLLK